MLVVVKPCSCYLYMLVKLFLTFSYGNNFTQKKTDQNVSFVRHKDCFWSAQKNYRIFLVKKFETP